MLRRFFSSRPTLPPWPKFNVSPEIRKALINGDPVVALESTIISHGMPYPRNVAVANQVEAVVRQNGATPATIAVIDGIVTIGASAGEIERLGKPESAKTVVKASRRDLGPVIAQSRCASTTVAATMAIADMAGIGVFATGGVGGVHRGAETTFDVSADLTELGRTPVAVVCAGVKSILDIPKTLEFLETQGVTVLGLNCQKFPSFFTASSEYDCPNTVATPEEAAKVFVAMRNLSLRSGLLLAVPNPSGAEGAVVESAIQAALLAADAAGIRGRDITPFLLKRVNEFTKGVSLEANVSLILENAKVGALMAKEVAHLRASFSKPMFPRTFAPQTSVGPSKPVSPTSTTSDSDSEGVSRVAKVAAKIIKPKVPQVEFSDSSELDSDVGETDSRGVWTKQTRRVKSIASSLGPSPKRNETPYKAKVPTSGKKPTSSPVSSTKSKPVTPTASGKGQPSFQPRRDDNESDDAEFYRKNVWDKPSSTRGGRGGGGGPQRKQDSGQTRKAGPGGRGGFGSRQRGHRSYHTSASMRIDMQQPVVVGGAVLDIMCKPKQGTKLVLETSNPGHVTQQFGGVGRNISECLARLGAPVQLLSVVGDDIFGSAIKSSLTDLKIGGSVESVSGLRTAVYSALLNEEGGLVAGVADMDCFAAITPDVVKRNEAIISAAGCVVADANLSAETLRAIAEVANKHSVPMVFEPTSLAKCTRAVQGGILNKVAVLTPNKFEVVELANAWRASMGLDPICEDSPVHEESEDEAEAAAESLDSTSGESLNTTQAESKQIRERVQLAFGDDGKVTETPLNPESDDEPPITPGNEEEVLTHSLLASAQSLMVAMAAKSEGATINGRKHLFIKLGAVGVLALSCPPITTKEDLDTMLMEDFFTAAFQTDLDFKLFPAIPANVVNVTGAGDSMIAGIVWGICQGWDVDKCVKAGLSTAKLSVEAATAISPLVSPQAVSALMDTVMD